jgi:hypothetical protein
MSKIITIFLSIWLGSILFGIAKHLHGDPTNSSEQDSISVTLALVNLAFLLAAIVIGFYLMPGAVRYLYNRIVAPLLAKCGQSKKPDFAPKWGSKYPSRSKQRPRQRRRSRIPSLDKPSAPSHTAEESRTILLRRENRRSQEQVIHRMNEILRPVKTRKNYSTVKRVR